MKTLARHSYALNGDMYLYVMSFTPPLACTRFEMLISIKSFFFNFLCRQARADADVQIEMLLIDAKQARRVELNIKLL